MPVVVHAQDERPPGRRRLLILIALVALILLLIVAGFLIWLPYENGLVIGHYIIAARIDGPNQIAQQDIPWGYSAGQLDFEMNPPVVQRYYHFRVGSISYELCWQEADPLTLRIMRMMKGR